MKEKITIWIVTIEWQGGSSQFAESMPFRTEEEANTYAWVRARDFMYHEGDCEQNVYDDGSIYLVTPDGNYALIEYKQYKI